MTITSNHGRTEPLEHALGRTATVVHVVGEADSAARWGNELPVLATPVLMWLSEIAAMRVVDPCLTPAQMTVGVSHASTHSAPTPVGATVHVTATLEAVAGRTLTFAVTAHDDHAEVLTGHHVRAVVDKQRFVDKLSSRLRTAARRS
jgi:fluoroacetyl-CoA thioesterase